MAIPSTLRNRKPERVQIATTSLLMKRTQRMGLIIPPPYNWDSTLTATPNEERSDHKGKP